MRYKNRYDNGLFINLSVAIPKPVFDVLAKIAEETDRPKSWLIISAICNEIEQSSKPFEYSMSLPKDEPFDELEHTENAKKISAFFIKHFQHATIAKIHLVMLREIIGIPDKKEFLQAYKTLIFIGKLQEVAMVSKYNEKPMGVGVRLVSLPHERKLKQIRRHEAKKRIAERHIQRISEDLKGIDE
jgi:hypothetical protein